MSCFENGIIEGVLGVVYINFKGVDLGKTVADTVLSRDRTRKDIVFQQDGTAPSDFVSTGEIYNLTASFGEITARILSLLVDGYTTNAIPGSSSQSGTFGRDLQKSMRCNNAGVLKVTKQVDNKPSTDPQDIMYFYVGIADPDGDLKTYGADSQAETPVTFLILYKEFDPGDSATKTGAYGYNGDPVVEDVPAAPYINNNGPVILSGESVLATSCSITLDQNAAFVTSFSASDYEIKVAGIVVVPTAGVLGAGALATDKLTFTLPAASVVTGQNVSIEVKSGALKDLLGNYMLPATKDNITALIP